MQVLQQVGGNVLGTYPDERIPVDLLARALRKVLKCRESSVLLFTAIDLL